MTKSNKNLSLKNNTRGRGAEELVRVRDTLAKVAKEMSGNTEGLQYGGGTEEGANPHFWSWENLV